MRFSRFGFVIASIVLFQGCATVLNGYYDSVELKNAPDSLQISTLTGINIPVDRTTVRVRLSDVDNVFEQKAVTQIDLRSNLDPVLLLKHDGQERRVQVFGKIGAGWLILDILFGGVPCMVDAVTGNWNYYDPIDASFK